MNLLKSLFGTSSQTGPRTTRPSRASNLDLESLEDRRVMSVTFHGGPIIPHVQVESVYWGQDWKQPANRANQQQLDGFLHKIVSSSYMSMLGEYGVGKGSFGKSDVVSSGGPMILQTVSESDIQKLLTSEISQGRLPESNGSQLYIVYLPPWVHSELDVSNNALGHHGDFTMTFTHTGTRRGGTPVFSTTKDLVTYAVIPNPAGNDQGNNINGLSIFGQQTEITSHELAEAVTNPNLGGGWWDSDPASLTQGYEIGDLANQQYTLFSDGGIFFVQKEWSVHMNTCISPVFDTTWAWAGGGPTILTSGSTIVNGRKLHFEITTNFTVLYNWEIAPGDLAGWYIQG
jgi:hypothetical protein